MGVASLPLTIAGVLLFSGTQNGLNVIGKDLPQEIAGKLSCSLPMLPQRNHDCCRRPAGLARLCLALAKTDTKPACSAAIREKISAPTSTVIHWSFYL